MRKIHAFLIIALLSGVAGAQEYTDGHGPGLGIEENLGGLSGASFVWDAGKFRVDFLLGFAHASNINGDQDVTDFGVGGRFFYVVHRLERADFALGGGLAIVRESFSNPSGDETNIHIELGAQIRVFLAPNVALLASLGFVIVTADNYVVLTGPITTGNGDGTFGLGGQLLAGFGVTYYFR